MIGSTDVDPSDPIPKDVIEGNFRQKKATVEGVQLELAVVKQQLENAHEQMRKLIGLYQTLQAEFNGFKAQRAVELNAMVNGGPTERLSSADDRSSN